MDKEAVVCSKVDAVMEKLGVRRLVMGHTPNFTGIVSRCGGKILLIDTGISHAYGGVLSAARFTYSLTPTKKKGYWIEKEVVTAIYEQKEEVFVNSEREIQADFI
ncbi:hypothetical protein FRC00_011829 [Tulasnella sp. 408]|nr:hypothetical protein FRC00_011829 [Tulasnella sp. 408]